MDVSASPVFEDYGDVAYGGRVRATNHPLQSYDKEAHLPVVYPQPSPLYKAVRPSKSPANETVGKLSVVHLSNCAQILW